MAEPAAATERVRAHWAVVCAFAGVVAMTQVCWLAFASIDTDVARDLSVSSDTVGWLANVFPLAYVLVALPAGLALDRSFRPTLLLGAALTAVGAVVRLGGGTFAWLMAGQVLVAIAQPLVLGALTKITTGYLPSEHRPIGIAVGSAAQLLGAVIAFVMGPALRGAHGVQTLLIVQAVLAWGLAAGLALGLRRAPSGSAPPAGAGRVELRAVWSSPMVRCLAGLTFVGIGIFGALGTYLQPILARSRISSTDAGLMLAGMLVAGICGCAVVPPIIARRQAERAYLTGAVVWVGGWVLVLAAVHASVAADFVVTALIGVVLLAALPVILELTERRLGASGGVATSILLMTGNAGTLVVAVVVGVLTGDPALAFALMAAVALAGLPAARRLRVDASAARATAVEVGA